MTAAQKKNVERFKKAAAEAKKLRAKNPKLTQAEAVKKAFATLYGTAKKAAPKKTVKKKAAPKKVAKKKIGAHKDTRSHNVNIRVVSGVKELSTVRHNINTVLANLISERSKLKQAIVFSGKLGEPYYTAEEKKLMRKKITLLNKQILAIKKIAKEEEKAQKYWQ